MPGAGARASSAPRHTVTAAPPTTTTSPSSRVTPSSPTFSPPTKVPFVDPASRTRRTSPSTSIVAWLHDALGESTVMSACGDRPTSSGRPTGTGTVHPAARPADSDAAQPVTGSASSSGERPMRLPSMRATSRTRSPAS